MKYLLKKLKGVISVKDVLKVAKWELSTGIKNKTFLVLTFIIPIIIIIVGIVAGYFASREGQQSLKIGIIDETGSVENLLYEELQDSNLNLQKYSQSIEIDIEAAFKKENLDGLLIIPADIYQSNKVIYYYKDLQGMDINILRNMINPIIINKRLEDRGYPPSEIINLVQGIKVEDKSLKELAKESRGEEVGISSKIEMFLPLGLAMIMAMSSMFSGAVLMQSIIKEKSNRIVEIILSSISARALMIGKVIGYGILGLVQILIWLGTALLVANVFFNVSLEPLLNIKTLYMFIYFVFGFIMVASINAMVGSATKDVQTGSQSAGILVLIPIIPIYFSTAILKNPGGTISKVFSYIPFTTATAMLIRTGFSSPPIWEIILTYGILILATTLVLLFASKVFRVGMLMYGKSFSLKEILKWTRNKSY